MNTGSGRLLRAASDLKDRWRETREQWTDTTAQKFEEEFLQPLAPLLTQVNAAIVKFAELMQDAETECSDPDRENIDW